MARIKIYLSNGKFISLDGDEVGEVVDMEEIRAWMELERPNDTGSIATQGKEFLFHWSDVALVEYEK